MFIAGFYPYFEARGFVRTLPSENTLILLRFCEIGTLGKYKFCSFDGELSKGTFY